MSEHASSTQGFSLKEFPFPSNQFNPHHQQMYIISTGYSLSTWDTPDDGELSLCEGDCDNDNQCASGLVCFQRDGNVDNVPGCNMRGSLVDNKGSSPDDLVKDWDYCIRAEDHPDWPCTDDNESVCQDVSALCQLYAGRFSSA